MQQLSDVNSRMNVADEQRIRIMKTVDKIEQKTEIIPVLEERLDAIEPEMTKSREFRLKIEGGAVLARGFWLVGGGLAFFLLQHVWDFLTKFPSQR